MAASAAFAPAVRADDSSDSIWDILARNARKKQVDPDKNTAAALATIDTPEPILSFDTANNIQNAIAYYTQVVQQGGWQPPSRQTYNLQNGKDGRVVTDLKRHLMLVGDMPAAQHPNDHFDDDTDLAVRRFQVRHGIIPNGKIDEPTFYALQVSAEERLNQLQLNLLRVQAVAGNLTADRYVVVNIPAASIEAVEGGQVAQRHTAVVGRIDRPTPILDSKIQQVNFNPYWHVPKSLIEKDLIQYMNDDPDYLTKFNIHIYDAKGNEVMPTDIDWHTDDAVNYSFRQDPGAENSLGHCRINFPNKFDVYLHDTPSKSLFAENARFHSSGCVRVEGVDELVTWLLGPNGGWDQEAVDAVFNSNERLDVNLKSPTPIHTTYVSAWANRNGIVSFRDDVYKFDAQGLVDTTTA
ncbi:MAG TPA: L,D-transpeptidase family protein [Devosia sp.]|nr:L,D-transpeptidase family protein [Devosia sp.]